MYRTKIELDEERMIKDGINVDEVWEEINETAIKAHLQIESEGHYYTESFGHDSYFIYLLEKKEIFMKYVKFWGKKYNDDDEYGDLIDSVRKIGLKCNYV